MRDAVRSAVAFPFTIAASFLAWAALAAWMTRNKVRGYDQRE